MKPSNDRTVQILNLATMVVNALTGLVGVLIAIVWLTGFHF